MTTSLAERVKQEIASPSGDALLAALGSRPEGLHLSQFETDLRDWGLCVGLAYGMARAEQANESLETVAHRAREAAIAVDADWGRRLSRPPSRDEELSDIHAAYLRFRALVGSPESRDEALDEALAELGSAIVGACRPHDIG